MALSTVAREWGRIGLIGFGGPPAHIALLRALVVDRRGWLSAAEFEDANAACGLLPGPASTQLAMFCAFRAGGPAGTLVGGLAFILPAVVLILALSAIFLAGSAPAWIRGAAAGAGAAVAAVAVRAAWDLGRPVAARLRDDPHRGARALAYALISGVTAALAGAEVVLALIGCGVVELTLRERIARRTRDSAAAVMPIVPGVTVTGGLGALAWTAFKVGALSFGGGFVIIPLMQGDAVHVHHWMSGGQFLTAVALGQITPGPVVATIAAVGYAARGVGGGVIAALVAFAPSFVFVLLGASRFERLRGNRRARSFLDGAGPAAIGAIAGAAVPLAGAIQEGWQIGVLAVAAVAVVGLRRSVVLTLVATGFAGMIAVLAGAPAPG